MSNFSDYQLGVYLNGLLGVHPTMPFSFEGWRDAAKTALDPVLWDYVAGGAGDEFTQNANRDAFDRIGIVPRMLAGAAIRNQEREIFGHRWPAPVFLCPIGVIGVMTSDQHGDVATAKAAAETGIPMIGSTLMQDPLEEVATHLGATPGYFHLYAPNDRELTESFVRRAESAGYRAIVLTLDTWTLGYRPRDLAHAAMPQLSGACLANYTSDPVFLERLGQDPAADPMATAGLWAQLFGNPGLDWETLDWIRGLTDLPLLLKGICHPDDVRRGKDAGVDGIYCSNHGGRQAASAPALSFLADVVAAADGSPVFFDSGVRHGVDVMKALALGATAVGIGRPYGYAAAAAGTEGIVHLLRCVLAELDLTMGLNGYATLEDLIPEILTTLR